jgi:hypothetical protein
MLGTQSQVEMAGEDKLSGIASYMQGNDRSKWVTGLPTYGKARAVGVYPGIDLVYYGNQGQLEYDFVIGPGADASAIDLRFQGAKPVTDAGGNLVLAIGGVADKDAVRFKKPVVYQVDAYGARQEVGGSFVVSGTDEVLAYSSYLGGSSAPTSVNAMALNAAGDIYVTGDTASIDFPVTQGAFETSCPIVYAGDCGLGGMFYITGFSFVSKIAADGQSLIYSTYLGGVAPGDQLDALSMGTGIAVDANDEAWTTGITNTTGFPITSDAYQPYCSPTAVDQNPVTGQFEGEVSRCNGSLHIQTDYIAKLNSTGTQLLYGTFLGGTGSIFRGEAASALALDSAGDVYVTGTTSSYYPGAFAATGYYNYPTTPNAYSSVGQNFLNGGPNGVTDAVAVPFLTVLSADGHRLLYSSLVDGNCATGAGCVYSSNSLAVIIGKAVIGGSTDSASFPTTAGALGTTCVTDATGLCARDNAFVAVINPVFFGKSSLVYSTYLNGSAPGGQSNVSAVTFDAAANIYAGGYTSFPDFPTTPGVLQPACHQDPATLLCSTGFVTKLSATGGLVWSTFYGSPTVPSPTITSLAVDAGKDVYLATGGNGGASDVPVKNSFQNFTMNSPVIAELNPTGSKVLFGSFFGGGYNMAPFAIAVDAARNIYIAGICLTGNIPLVNAFLTTSYPETGFFAKIITAMLPSSVTLSVSPSTTGPGSAVTFTANVAGGAGLALPTGTVTFSSGGTKFGSAAVNSSGVATLVSSTVPVGTYAVVASYAGDASYTGSLSVAAPLTIGGVFSPAMVNFGSVAVGQTSPSVLITATNNSTSPATFISESGLADFRFQVVSCSASSSSTSLLPGATCSFNVSFAPAAVGPVNGQIVLSYGSGTTSLSLSGAGH